MGTEIFIAKTAGAIVGLLTALAPSRQRHATQHLEMRWAPFRTHDRRQARGRICRTARRI